MDFRKCSDTKHNQENWLFTYLCVLIKSFPGGSDSKESACNSGDPGLISGLGRSPGEGNLSTELGVTWELALD